MVLLDMRITLIGRAAAAALLIATSASLLVAQQATGSASVRGLVYDSVRARPMGGAQIAIQGTTLSALTDSVGRFHFDSVPPGQYRLVAAHPLLDSIGIQLVTAPLTLLAGHELTITMATPSPGGLVKMLCPAAWLTRGPAALFGRVRNADTEQPVAKAQVSVVWYDVDLLKVAKVPRLRETMTNPDGTYRICGLPDTFDGKLQVQHAGLKSGDVPVNFNRELLQLRSMSVASTEPATVAAGDTNPPVRRAVTVAQLSGMILNGSGKPVGGVRVQLEGTARAVNSGPDGRFKLDSLPSGSQVVRALLIGYTPVERPVELSSTVPKTITLEMDNSVALLPTVKTEAARTSALDDIGFTRRRQMGMGYFMDEAQIDKKQATRFSDLLRSVPGLNVTSSGNETIITDQRTGGGGCVKFVVDGSPWASMTPGDIDQFVLSSDVAAIEVYHGIETPPEYQLGGTGGCVTILAWTKWRLDRGGTKK